MSTPGEVADLLREVGRGDSAAFEALYRATCAKLYGVVLRILRRQELAGEVLEQAYLQIWRRARAFDVARWSALAWMVAIARRVAIDASRAPRPAGEEADPDTTEQHEGPASVPRQELTDSLKRLLTCIGRLDPDRQRMLLLAYYGAFTHEQLSAKLGISADQVRESLRKSLLEVEQCLTS